MLNSYTNIDKEHVLNVNIRYDTKTELTPRILEISTAFGLGVSDTKKFTIFKDFKIGFSTGDIMYITGDSGGGKTTLLKYINAYLESEKDESKPFLEDCAPNKEDVVVESLGDSVEQAIYYLSAMGLNDAFIFLRKFGELSDGQKYRYKLAKLLSTKPKFLFIDEFCANLDRTTAKVIAHNLQKVCRNNNISLFVATTHEDLIEDLNPSILIRKNFMDNVTIDYIDYVKKKISFYSDVVIEEGTLADYNRLSKYHYKNTSNRFPYKKIFRARYGKEIVGVAVYSPPFLQTKGRSIYFDKKYSLMTKEVVADINKLFIRRSRNIISPKYRGCGLGQKLALESMLSIKDAKYIEAINVMGRYNPVNEKIGMTKIEITEETDPPTIRLTNWIQEKGLKLDEIHNPTYWKDWLFGLSDEDKNTIKLMTGKVLHHPKLGLSGKDGRRAEVVAQEQRYIDAEFDDVKDEILIQIPKLFSGNTLYYVIENPNYIPEDTNTLDKWTN